MVTYCGWPVTRLGIGIRIQVVGDAWAPEGPENDQAEAGQGARWFQRWGTRDGGLMMKRRNPTQNPIPCISQPESTSRTVGPPGAFLWETWLSPPPSLLTIKKTSKSRCGRTSEKVTFT